MALNDTAQSIDSSPISSSLPKSPIPTSIPTMAPTCPDAKPWSVQAVLSTLPTAPPPNPTTPVPFFHLLERLKTTPREGWRRFSISPGESISDHMYRMSIMTMLAPPSLSTQLNIPHCTKMALIHDMAESLVGDITPVDNVSKSEKGRREADSMDYLTRDLLGRVGDGGTAGEAMRAIFREYEANETLEAKFVHDVDKMELVLQMVEYERREGGRVDLGEFVHVAEKIALEEVRGWCAEVLREREAFWKGVGREPELTDVGRRVIERAEGENMGPVAKR